MFWVKNPEKTPALAIENSNCVTQNTLSNLGTDVTVFVTFVSVTALLKLEN